MHEDITLLQKIWEQTNEEQGEASFLDIRRFLQRREDINMGWINVRWGVPQIPNASTNLPHEAVLAMDKVVEQLCVSLFLVQLTIKGSPTMLSLEAPSDFITTG